MFVCFLQEYFRGYRKGLSGLQNLRPNFYVTNSEPCLGLITQNKALGGFFSIKSSVYGYVGRLGYGSYEGLWVIKKRASSSAVRKRPFLSSPENIFALFFDSVGRMGVFGGKTDQIRRKPFASG